MTDSTRTPWSPEEFREAASALLEAAEAQVLFFANKALENGLTRAQVLDVGADAVSEAHASADYDGTGMFTTALVRRLEERIEHSEFAEGETEGVAPEFVAFFNERIRAGRTRSQVLAAAERARKIFGAETSLSEIDAELSEIPEDWVPEIV